MAQSGRWGSSRRGWFLVLRKDKLMAGHLVFSPGTPAVVDLWRLSWRCWDRVGRASLNLGGVSVRRLLYVSPAHEDWAGGKPVLGSLKGSHLGVLGPTAYSLMPGVLSKPESFLQVWALVGQQLQSLLHVSWRLCPPSTQFQPIFFSAGRTLRPNPDAGRIFKEFVMSKMPRAGRIITPPHAGRREFPRSSFLLSCLSGLCSGYFSYT